MEAPCEGSPPRCSSGHAIMSRSVKRVKALSVTLSVALFLFQTGSNIALWLREPLTSSFTIDDDHPPEMPSVTVCPNPPFNVHALIELGLNLSSGSPEELVRRVDGLEGVDAPVEEVWDRAAWSLGDVIHHVRVGGQHFEYSPGQTIAPGWQRSLTPLGPCFTFTNEGPASLMELNIEYPLKSCQFAFSEAGYLKLCHIIESRCNTSCIWEEFVQRINKRTRYNNTNVILHPPDDPPTLATSKSIMVFQDEGNRNQELEVWVNARRVQSITSKTSACNSDAEYSEDLCRQRCLELCHPRSQARRPNHPTWKETNLQFSCRNLMHKNLTEDDYKCREKCKPRCSRLSFRYSTVYHKTNLKSSSFHLRIRQNVNYQTTITEILAYPTARLLADIGGNLGFFLGISLLSFWSAAVNLLQGLWDFMKDTISLAVDDSFPKGIKSHFKREQNSPLKKITKQTIEHGHRQKLFKWIGLMIMIIAMSVHALTAITAYIWQPVATLLSLGDDSQPLPEILVCPYFPFDINILTHFNIDAPLFCMHDKMIMSTYLNNLPGVWHEEGVDIQRMWQESARNITDYISLSARSRPILTTNNICHMVKPSNDEDRSIILKIPESSKKDIHFHCFVKKLLILFPERGTEPVMIHKNKIYSQEFQMLLPDKQLTLSSLVMERVLPCHPLPYRRTTCIEHCLLEAATHAVGCSFPYINMSNIPACATHTQYVNSVKYVVDTNSPPFTTLNVSDQCNNKCPKECSTQYYHISAIKNVDSLLGTNELHITLSLVQRIQEFFSQSFFKLLSELGGIVGLYVGWSALEAGEILTRCLVTISVSVGVIRTMQHHAKGVAMYTFQMLCLMVAAVLWTERVSEYVWNHPFYTHYGIQPIRSQDFPSLTVCRWPPFNLSRLLALGLRYDIDKSCTYTGRFYRCYYGTETLRDLPGVWSKSIDEVWEKSAWELKDLVHSFQIDGKEFQITDEEAAARWRPSVTEHNRCFTFTPAEKGDLTSYEVKLNTDYRGERLPRRNHTCTLLHHSLRRENEPHTFLRIHDRKERLYSLHKDDFYQRIHYARPYLREFSLSLLRTTKIPREGHECETSSRYSQFECQSRCKTSFVGRRIQCRLPYDTWSHLPLCNASAYPTFPRLLGTSSTSLIILGEDQKKNEEVKCRNFCLPACTQNIYTASSTTFQSQTKTVIVGFSESTFDDIREEDGYVWAQLVSDLGGVGGFMMGVSLLSLLDTLVALVEKALDGTRHSK